MLTRFIVVLAGAYLIKNLTALRVHTLFSNVFNEMKMKWDTESLDDIFLVILIIYLQFYLNVGRWEGKQQVHGDKDILVFCTFVGFSSLRREVMSLIHLN